jgi:hypothetical protein
MAVNPNIALSVRGLELPDPLAQYAKVQQIQGAQQQNALAQMQMQQAQREVAQRNALNRAYAQAYSHEGEFDINRLRTSLATGGFGSQIPAAEKSFAEMQKARTERQKVETDLLDARLKQSREFLNTLDVNAPDAAARYIAWHEANHADPVIGPALAARGVTIDTAGAQINEALSKPGGLAELINRSKLGTEKFMEMNKPTTQFVDLPGGEKAAMRVVPGQAPVKLQRYEAGMTPDQKRQARTDQRRLALEERRIKLQEQEQDPAFQRAKAAAMEEGKLAARDENTAINTTPAILEEAGAGLGILTRMIGERDKDGNLVPGSQPHPGFKDAVGASITLAAPGTEKRNFQVLYDQIMGQAFLQAFERLKGAGQITEIEGQKATAAITSLSLAQTENDFVREAMRLQDLIDKLSERAVNRYNELTKGRSDVIPMEYTRLNRSMDPEQQRARVRELFK